MLNLVGLVCSSGSCWSIIKGEGLDLYRGFKILSIFQVKVQMLMDHFKVRYSLCYFRIKGALIDTFS